MPRIGVTDLLAPVILPSLRRLHLSILMSWRLGRFWEGGPFKLSMSAIQPTDGERGESQ